MVDRDDDQEGNEITLWLRTIDALMNKGATRAEAIDGAHLLLKAIRRERERERESRESGPGCRDELDEAG